ncbi:glycosyltransferase family 4 protein [Frigidibacter sp. RF13]|uniref:glycosyltransferase family 4 protein n=1 Tax=Frigidibacter sp. RF13 TaxID=2997340 RepID=UPI00226EDF31|nr:glycosyltransferase family 4 protein [Frigidibacter sp. RF13]MCY1126556.1 glycosyltransferase family 4 protein [Frigidibacter sp. RF13]
MKRPSPPDIAVIAPNLKRRLSGVTTTVVRLLPLQARMIGIVATGPGLPDHLPHLALWRCFLLPRVRWRVWHARRNTEMALGLILRHLFRRRLRLLFTSAAQRHHKGFTKWLIRRMDRVVATSPQAASYLEVPATVVMHGVDCQIFEPATDKRALRRELGLPEEACLIGCFGRIRAQKGVDLMVDAALALLPGRPEVQMIFTGRVTDDQKGFFEEQQARLRAAGVADRVHFLGEIDWDAVARHYRALDLFCAPARWEGFGLTPLEAMASGVPVVASRVGAFEALIRPGETGTLVAAGDAAALTEAIRDWIDDPARLAAAGPVARAHVETNHRIEGEAERLVAIYREMLA